VPSVGHTPHLSPWGRLVALSAVVVVGCLVGLGAWAAASTKHRVASYSVSGTVSGVALDLDGADVVIARGGRRRGVEVYRMDRYAFGLQPRSRPEASAGQFRLVSRCPMTVLHSCSVSYRVVVPDSVSIDLRTGSGSIRLEGYRGPAQIATRSGDVSVTGYCGFSLQARTESGNIDASTLCSPPQLSLRATHGNVRAVVPAGRYRLDAETAGGTRTVQRIADSQEAPFSIQALSSAGDVTVEGRQ
jgi:hypothetical protein